MQIKQLFKRPGAGDSGVAFLPVPFLCFLMLLAGVFLLFFAGSAMAAGPASLTLGFTNTGDSKLQIAITDTDTETTETLQVPAGQTVEKTWEFTDPGVKHLLVKNTAANTTDPVYSVTLYSVLDEATGELTVRAIAQNDETGDKVEELRFHPEDEPEEPTKPEEPETKPEKPTKPKTPPADKPADDSKQTNYKTGDSAHPVLWIGISAGFAVLVILLFVLLIRRRRKEDGAQK